MLVVPIIDLAAEVRWLCGAIPWTGRCHLASEEFGHARLEKFPVDRGGRGSDSPGNGWPGAILKRPDVRGPVSMPITTRPRHRGPHGAHDLELARLCRFIAQVGVRREAGAGHSTLCDRVGLKCGQVARQECCVGAERNSINLGFGQFCGSAPTSVRARVSSAKCPRLCPGKSRDSP